MCERERVCVREGEGVCVREREGVCERESVCVCERERDRERAPQQGFEEDWVMLRR